MLLPTISWTPKGARWSILNTYVEQRYNPELQKRSLANREQAQKDFDNFVGKLKEYSKSSKTSTCSQRLQLLLLLTSATVWDVAAEDQARIKAQALEEQEQVAAAAKARSEQLRQEAMSKR